ncbi:cobyrinic acid a,c-diamide synthase (plasmid) [Scytonema sp. HK-05]|uniref:MinD/ParA family ATP-binding protein n=1 Tax=Scytonema sp. HK-05 TaxID=1137095 RepID=UPI00093733C2|nr:MinD/ParA family protein [Scytonema sp. HK-05]OKH57074.1 CDP-3,6-dideoxy-D-glycero-L-glycero-4-hexulose-4-reductase [Scytonema sp. HK-05]BAY50273.1 cobyrinic acid a,c-diamide synthase [Scytonema sp. HK-05]
MSKVVSIHSFRGGTGKSNITANLATIIARSGKRVGIVDTDIQSPGIHVPFGLDEEKIEFTLNDYLWGHCAIEKAAYDITPTLRTRQKGAAIKGKIYLVPSSIRTSEISRILREGYDARLLNDGFSDLCRRLKLDYLFIDTHPGINEETLLSIIISHVLIVILRPDYQDYQGTAVAVDVARKLEVPKMLLVVNKALLGFDFEALRQQVQKSYDATVASVLPVCEEMFHLASSDVFCLCYPEHPWTQQVNALAKLL